MTILMTRGRADVIISTTWTVITISMTGRRAAVTITIAPMSVTVSLVGEVRLISSMWR